MNELRPVFVVTVDLDGDDSPSVATDVVRERLRQALARMERDGEIRGYTLRVDGAYVGGRGVGGSV